MYNHLATLFTLNLAIKKLLLPQPYVASSSTVFARQFLTINLVLIFIAVHHSNYVVMLKLLLFGIFHRALPPCTLKFEGLQD